MRSEILPSSVSILLLLKSVVCYVASPQFKTCINFFNLACICESVFFFLRLVSLEYMLKVPQVWIHHTNIKKIRPSAPRKMTCATVACERAAIIKKNIWVLPSSPIIKCHLLFQKSSVSEWLMKFLGFEENFQVQKWEMVYRNRRDLGNVPVHV